METGGEFAFAKPIRIGHSMVNPPQDNLETDVTVAARTLVPACLECEEK